MQLFRKLCCNLLSLVYVCLFCVLYHCNHLETQKIFTKAADVSFNVATIDGDTSTNDTVIALANGVSGSLLALFFTKCKLMFPCQGVKVDSKSYEEFCEALDELCTVLAVEMVRDGEGVTKLVRVRVVNAPSIPDARSVAKTISHSMLVKTALFGSDGNWVSRAVCVCVCDVSCDVVFTSPFRDASWLQLAVAVFLSTQETALFTLAT